MEIKYTENKIIISGHTNKEDCETLTLLAKALSTSDDFKTIKYEPGYVEFKKISTTDNLLFGFTDSIEGKINDEGFNILATQYMGEENTFKIIAGNLEISAMVDSSGLHITNVGNLAAKVALQSSENLILSKIFVDSDISKVLPVGGTVDYEFVKGILLKSPAGVLEDNFEMTVIFPVNLN